MARHSGAGVSSFTTDRIQGSVLRLAAVLLGLFGATASRAADEVATVYFGTDVVPNEWLITGAGGTNVPAVLVTPYPEFISFSSTGTATGQFIPGASWAAFDGAWTADLSFELPRRAQDVYLDFFDLYADDRAVLLFNGVAIGDGTMNGDVGVGQHTFEPGDEAQSFTFSQTTEGRIDDRNAFILGDRDSRGKENVLRLSVNNTGTGNRTSAAQALPPGSNNGTVARVRGLVRWTEDYQIRPYPNPADNLVDVDDDPHGWYNAVAFDNEGTIGIDRDGWLTNRAGAVLTSHGVIWNQGRFDIAADSTVRLLSGQFDNTGSITVAGLLEDRVGIHGSGTSTLTVNPGGTLRVTPSAAGHSFVSEGTVTNRGGFVVGEFAVADMAVLQNFGHVTASGAEHISARGIYNDGRIEVRDSELRFSGSFENRAAGVVDIQAGGSLGWFIDLGAPVGEAGPPASNLGTLNVHGGNVDLASLDNSGQLAVLDAGDVEVEGRLANDGAGHVYVLGLGSRLVTPSLENHGVIDVTGFMELDFVGGSIVDLGSYNEGTITVDEGTTPPGPGGGIGYGGVLTIRTSLGNTGTVTVRGVGQIDVERDGSVSGGYLDEDQPGTFFVLDGGTLQIDGTFDENRISCNGGILKGGGTIRAGASVDGINGCSLRMGNSPGTLSILGSLEMDSSAEIEVEIGSPDDYDRLVFGDQGRAEFGGAHVRVTFVDGYLADERDDFAWLGGIFPDSANNLNYDIPADWQHGVATDSTNTTHLSLASTTAQDLGGGLNPGVVIGAGQVAFVEPTGLYSDYQNGGVFDNSGAVHNREGSLFRNAGTFSSAPGSLVNRAGAWFVNRGQFINDFGAPLENAGTFYNHATGVLDNQSTITNGPGARFVNRGQVSNSDTIVNAGRFENRGEIANHGDFGNRGEVAITAGASLHDGNYTQTAGRTQVDANGVLAAYMIFTGGTLGGNGRLEGDLYLGQALGDEGFTTATLDPGDPLAAGRLELAGNFTLDGILHIDIAGAALHDVLAVDGTLTSRDSTLEVALLDGYDPQLGDRFDYLTARSSGPAAGFAHLLLPGLDPGLAWVTRYLDDGILATYGLEVVTSEVPAPASVGLFASALGIAAARMRRRARGCRVASGTGAATRPADALPL